MSVFEPVIRIVVAEDHPMMLEAVLARLDMQPDLAVVAVATNGEQLVNLYARHRPDIVLTDVAMAPMNGIEAARRIRELDPDARILVLSGHDDPAFVNEAARVGAAGYVLKTVRGDDLYRMIRAVAANEAVLPADGAEQSVIDLNGASGATGATAGTLSVAGYEALSPRELEIITHAADGLSYRAIGAQLGITENTVKTHLSNVYAKLRVTNRTQAVLRAIDLGLIRQPRGAN